MVKTPPVMQETGVPSLGWEDPLEEGMATHSSILAWEFPGAEEPGGLQSTSICLKAAMVKGQEVLSDSVDSELVQLMPLNHKM